MTTTTIPREQPHPYQGQPPSYWVPDEVSQALDREPIVELVSLVPAGVESKAFNYGIRHHHRGSGMTNCPRDLLENGLPRNWILRVEGLSAALQPPQDMSELDGLPFATEWVRHAMVQFIYNEKIYFSSLLDDLIREPAVWRGDARFIVRENLPLGVRVLELASAREMRGRWPAQQTNLRFSIRGALRICGVGSQPA